MQEKWEYGIVEWLWNEETIRCNLPGGEEFTAEGSYPRVVEVLTELGGDGWEVASCVASANWIFWTLKRSAM